MVCTEGGVTAEHVRCLHQMIPGVAPLLPAEGALFLTNYRIIFKGTPKGIRTHAHLEHALHDGLQLRSATAQLIKVTSEQTEAFRKQLARARHPQHPTLHFALAPRAAPAPALAQPKHHTLKGFAKKTLLKTARRAGLKPKPSKRQKYVLPSADERSLTSPPLMSSLSADTLSLEELDLGSSESAEAPAARTLERVRERAYARDWARLGLADPPFRLAHANAVYTLCRSYPGVIAVPESISDESLRRCARTYRQNRSGASHRAGVMGMLKSSSHQTTTAAQGSTETTSSLEQERFLSTLVNLTPASRGDLEDSSLSLDSLLLC
ncbi:unnamed protein product [Leptidea sinapis]|uniref:Myotubularin phosphatase domain-containing protein n=1 Tax=Leptidea sinapis TaxID=189913 RepID=A0A5E4QBG9_9NEOP|nr:unnamed protein product [Leptidea sinapis]